MSDLRKHLSNVDQLFARDVRYTCSDCQDTGWVTIWKPQTIQAAAAGKPVQWLTCLVRCTCSVKAPDVYRAGLKRGKLLPVFGAKPWHINAKSPNAKQLASEYQENATTAEPAELF